MALLNLNFCSSVLGMNTSAAVFLPERRGEPHPPIGEKKYPVLYLLHGHMQDYSSWIRNSMLEYYVAKSDLIVVMPDAAQSFYADAVHGLKYFSYMTQELPVVVQNWFPASAQRSENYVAGLSMGGYGAFKMALRRPDLFCAAASLSGCLCASELPSGTPPQDPDLAVGFPTNPAVAEVMEDTLGKAGDYKGSFNDLEAAVLEIIKENKPRPSLFQCIGTEDYLYEDNAKFKSFMEKEGGPLDYTYWESPGRHDWQFWDKAILKTLQHWGLV